MPPADAHPEAGANASAGVEAGTTRRIGCYTTARVSAGRVERVERHVRRLRRDAARLGLPLPSSRAVEDLLLRSARERFGDGHGIVRIEWSHAPGTAPELRSTPRALGVERSRWRARVSETPHPGPEARRNTKYVDIEAIRRARAEAERTGVDEVLLFDAAGFLVEGSGSNALVVDAEDRLLTPARSLGAVEGLGLGIVRESRPEIREARLTIDDVRSARELMATNGVRGVVSIVELDGKPIGSGEPGPWARRLRTIFFRD